MAHKATVISLLTAVVVAAASCGADATVPGDSPTKPTDPAVTAAAAAVQPMLERSFADTFAGLEIRHDVPMLIVYRKPDPKLEAKDSRAAPGVRVEFRDAKYSLVEMQAAGDRLMDERDYWEGRGMTVVSVGPAVDGSGVQVTTSNEAGDLVDALHERYPAMSFSVRKGSDVVPPVYTGPVPPWTGPRPTQSKQVITLPPSQR